MYNINTSFPRFIFSCLPRERKKEKKPFTLFYFEIHEDDSSYGLRCSSGFARVVHLAVDSRARGDQPAAQPNITARSNGESEDIRIPGPEREKVLSGLPSLRREKKKKRFSVLYFIHTKRVCCIHTIVPCPQRTLHKILLLSKIENKLLSPTIGIV